jgi:MOSC domain-containing protein YiiM
MNPAGTLIAIFLKRAHAGPMDSATSAVLDEKGLIGDANRGTFRAITLLSEERWRELMDEVDAGLPPQARRANLILSGVDLENSRGKKLRIGACRFLIGGETRPCELMEQAATGLQKAMSTRWGGGAYATVLEPGTIALGNTVTWDL